MGRRTLGARRFWSANKRAVVSANIVTMYHLFLVSRVEGAASTINNSASVYSSAGLATGLYFMQPYLRLPWKLEFKSSTVIVIKDRKIKNETYSGRIEPNITVIDEAFAMSQWTRMFRTQLIVQLSLPKHVIRLAKQNQQYGIVRRKSEHHSRWVQHRYIASRQLFPIFWG